VLAGKDIVRYDIRILNATQKTSHEDAKHHGQASSKQAARIEQHASNTQSSSKQQAMSKEQ
jgi:hypothetical protein